MEKNIVSTSFQVLLITVLAIMAFIRGKNAQWVLLIIFTVWFASLVGLVLYRHRAQISYWFHQQGSKLQQRQKVPNVSESNMSSEPETKLVSLVDGYDQLRVVLLRYLNCRISDKLKSAYPEVTWDWITDQPELIALKGGTGRIIIHQAGEFTHADVTVDKLARINFKLLKMVAFEDLLEGDIENDREDESVPAEQTVTDVSAWFDLVGNQQITAIITELNARGHRTLSISENGEIYVVEDLVPIKLQTLENLPTSKLWPELSALISEIGIRAQVDGDYLRLAW